MSISNLQQNFNKGNSLPQSPGLIVRRMTAGSRLRGVYLAELGQAIGALKEPALNLYGRLKKTIIARGF